MRYVEMQAIPVILKASRRALSIIFPRANCLRWSMDFLEIGTYLRKKKEPTERCILFKPQYFFCKNRL